MAPWEPRAGAKALRCTGCAKSVVREASRLGPFSASSRSYVLKPRALASTGCGFLLSGARLHPGLGFLFRGEKATERPLEYEEVAVASRQIVLFLFKKRPRM